MRDHVNVAPVTSSSSPRLHRRPSSLLLLPTLTSPPPVLPTIQTQDVITTVDTNPWTGDVPIVAPPTVSLRFSSSAVSFFSASVTHGESQVPNKFQFESGCRSLPVQLDGARLTICDG
jgi:hypothetical protein